MVVAVTVRKDGEFNQALILSSPSQGRTTIVDSELITWNVYELAKHWPFASNTTNKYTFDVK